MASRTVLCPSATCEEGALLLGRVVDSEVEFASRPVWIDPQIASGLRARGDPERLFRFSAPCATSGCGQWATGRCGVIDTVMNAPQSGPAPHGLPSCLIRNDCRWFLQRGADACGLCRFVVTNNADIDAHPAA